MRENYMMVPDEALRHGFVTDPVGPHASRTMLLADLQLLLSACPPDATLSDYRAAVVDQNVLMKATKANRRETFQRLCQFYALDPDVPLFRVLRALWDADEAGQPLLALPAHRSVPRHPALKYCTASSRWNR